MEKIKQALERAREQQRADATKAPVPEQPCTNADHLDEGRISYSKTRVVSLNPTVLERNRIVTGTVPGDAAMAYKILRTQVDQRLAAQGWNSLAITSPGIGEGKTLTAINLSVALARELHRTVLLVDLDLRNPSVLRYFEQEARYGLVDYLNGNVPLSDILVNPGIERLVILPAGRPVTNSSELLASPRMVKLVEELKSRYPSRIIVFDLPPLLSADDTLAFSPYVDTTLLVIEDGKTTLDEVVQSIEMLKGVHVLGSVLNRATETQPAYYATG